MGILDSPPGFITGGELRYCGQNMLAMPEEQRRRIRGPEISMVFQDALTALEPGVLGRLADRRDVPQAPRA